MLPIAFFIAGLLPILLWNRRAKVNFNIYLLGWLSWFCSVSVKIFIATIQGLNWPVFFTNPSLMIINSTILETIEVLSAFFFLKYHPALKDVRNWKGIVAFGLGFGCGEALTLGVILLSSISVPFSLEFIVRGVFLGGIVERLSAIAIHLSSACFLAFFLITRKKSDFIMGLLSKDLTIAITTIFSVVLPLALLPHLALFELIIAIYAIFWIVVLLHVRRKEEIPEELPEHAIKIKMDSVNVLIPAVVFFFSLYLWSKIITPALTLSPFLKVLSQIVFFFFVTIAIYSTLGKIRNASATEVLVAGATSLTLYIGVQNIICGLEPNAGFLVIAMIPFFGVLCAAGVYKFLIRTGKSQEGKNENRIP